MELKDLILQTLDEVAQDTPLDIQESNQTDVDSNVDSNATTQQDVPKSSIQNNKPDGIKFKMPKTSIESSPTKEGKVISPNLVVARQGFTEDQIKFLENLREKLLILFEGLKMPQLQDQAAKLDLVINFLQYELCLIDEFLQKN